MDSDGFGYVVVGDEDAARLVAHAALNERVTHHAPNITAQVAHETMRGAVAELGHKAIDTCPLSPELTEALRKLTDEVLAGFNAAIARNHDRIPPQE